MMQIKIDKFYRRTWLLCVLLLCLLPLMGTLLSHAAEDKTCPKCGAVLTIVDQYDATCTVEGSTVYKCNECNNHVEIVTTPLRNHSWKKRSETPATCLEPAMATYRCRNCDLEKVEATEDSAPLGHDYAETIVEPTCGEDGYTLHACTRCEDSYQTDVVAKVDHTYTLEIYEAPTCEQIGFGRNICTVCGYHEKVELSRADHSEISQTVSPTHTEQGYTSYTCQHCGAGRRDNFTEPKPYDMVWTTQEATCTESGFRMGVCADGCGHTETVLLPPAGHEYGQWEVIHIPDEDSAGLDSRTCKHCEYIETRSVPFVPDEPEDTPKQITPMMVLIAIFFIVFMLALLVMVALLLLESSGRGRKRKRRRPISKD